MNRERLRLVLIGSSVVAATLSLLLGIPRARAFLTPRIDRVWVVSAALGDDTASVLPREALLGTPVTLYAIVEGTSRLSGDSTLYGTVGSVVLEEGGEPRPVREWKGWWWAPEFLWFKVEPALPFANEDFSADFALEEIPYGQNYQVSWGFGWRHAADVQVGGDAFPDWDSGTMRYAVRAVVRDHRDRVLQQAESPGAGAVTEGDPARAPHRVTLQAGEDDFGVMLGYAGLPYVPTVGEVESGRHPVNRYLGGTILDFWLAARRATGAWSGGFVDWERLPEVAGVVVEEMFLASDGAYYHTDDPLRAVSWEDLRPGDLVVIEDHVGVLYEDRGPGGGGDGVLNRWDRALEAYFEPLRQTSLGDAFVSGISVYRLPER